MQLKNGFSRQEMTKDEIAKQEIVLKAQALFQQFGLKKTTMDEIAFACGKAKSTLYHYFKSKEEVFDEVLKVEVTNLRRIVKAKVDEAKTLKEKVLNYFVAFHTEVVNKMNLYRIIKFEMEVDSFYPAQVSKSNRKEMMQRFIEFEKNYLTRIFEDAYDAGEFTKIEREDISFFAETLIAAFLGVMAYTIENNATDNNEKLLKTANILINQILS